MSAEQDSANEVGDGLASDAATEAAGGDWRASISDPDLRRQAEKFTSPAAVLKSYSALQQKLGRAVVPPGEGASQEDIEAYHRRLGVPDDPTDYGLARPEDWPQELPFDDGLLGQAADLFQDIGLNRAQAKQLADWYNEASLSAARQLADQEKRAIDTAAAALRRDWGRNFESQMELADRAFRRFFGKDTDVARQVTLSDGSKLGNNPLVIRAFAEIGRQIGESGAPFGDSPGAAGRAPEEEMDALMGSADYWTNQAKQRRVREIGEQLFGGEST